jgi:hypothetical protein
MDKKIVTTVITLLLLSVLLSGCIGEKRIDPVPLNDTVDVPSTKPDLQHQEVNKSEISVNLSSKRTTILMDEIEIELISFSNIYTKDNRNINGHNISKQYYAVYNLSIKNTGSKAFDLRSDEFNLRSGDRIFKQTAIVSKAFDWVGLSYISRIENEMNDTTLLPGQTINGSVIFGVSSPYDTSFLLMYNMTPVDFASFGKSLDAIKAAELFNYSIALDIPPYYADSYEPPYLKNTYDPPEADYYSGKNLAYPLFIWSNWVNRSILELYNELDTAELDRFRNSSDLPVIASVYRSKVIPEINITLFPLTTQEFATSFLVIDDTGEEIFDRSFFYGKWGIAICSGNTYKIQQFKEGVNFDTRQMTFINATIVWMTFGNYYGWPAASRWNYNTQVVIFDENQNIIAVIYDYAHLVS